MNYTAAEIFAKELENKVIEEEREEGGGGGEGRKKGGEGQEITGSSWMRRSVLWVL